MNLPALVYQKLKAITNRLKRFRVYIHKEFFYEHKLEQLPPISESALEIKKLCLSDIKVLHQVWPVDLDQIRSRLEGKHSECYLSYLNDRLVGYHWVQFKGKHFVRPANQSINLSKGDDFMIYHIRVVNEFQGLGMNRNILNRILHDYKQKGYCRGLIYTSSKNIANQKSLEKIGFIKYAKVRSLHITNYFLPLCRLGIH